MELELVESLSTDVPTDEDEDSAYGLVPGVTQPLLECFHFASRVEPDLDMLFAGRSDGSLLMWRLQDANQYGGKKNARRKVEVIKSVSAHSGRVNCLLYFREEQGALWGSSGGAQGQGNRAAMALNRTKGFLFSGASDRCVKVWNIWDVGRREVGVQTLTGHEGSVMALLATGDGGVLSLGLDGSIKIWRWQHQEAALPHAGASNPTGSANNTRHLPSFALFKSVGGGPNWSTACALSTPNTRNWTLYVGDNEGAVFVFKRQLPCPPPSALPMQTQIPSGTQSQSQPQSSGSTGAAESLGCLLLKQELSREALARSDVACTDVWRRPRMKGISAMLAVTEQNLLVMTCVDATCLGVDGADGRPFFKLRSPSAAVFSGLAWDADNGELLLGDDKGHLQVWDILAIQQPKIHIAITGKEDICVDNSRLLSGLMWAGNGSVLCGLPASASLRKYSISRSSECHVLSGHVDCVVSLDALHRPMLFMPPTDDLTGHDNALDRDCTLLSVSHDGTLRRWDDYAGKEYSHWKLKHAHKQQDSNSNKSKKNQSNSNSNSISMSKKSGKANGNGKGNGGSSLSPVRSPRSPRALSPDKGRGRGSSSSSSEVTSMRLLQHLRLAMTGHDDGTVRWWDIESGYVTVALGSHGNSVSGIAPITLPTGTNTASSGGGVSSERERSSLATTSAVSVVRGEGGGEGSRGNTPAAAKYNTKLVAVTCSFDCRLGLWSKMTGADGCLHPHLDKTLPAGDEELLCVTYNEKHGVIACGGNDCELRLWRLASLDKCSKFSGHAEPITALGTHENLLFSGDGDGVVRVWSLTTLQFQGLLPLLSVCQAHSVGSGVTALCLVPMLEILVTCSTHERNVRVWDFGEAAVVDSRSHTTNMNNSSAYNTHKTEPQGTQVLGSGSGSAVLLMKEHSYHNSEPSCLVYTFKNGRSDLYVGTTEGKILNFTIVPKAQVRYESLEDVQRALRRAGLEKSDLIIGIDFTKSNEWTGAHTFGGRCMHDVSPAPAPSSTGSMQRELNPYEHVVSILASTLSAFDDDQLIPAYGFGDSSTKCNGVFSFYSHDRPCHGLDDVLRRYRTLARGVKLSGPTNFAPLIYKAIDMVKKKDYSFHVLLIIADGQVTEEAETVQAIVDASRYPLAIVQVGVGDGPWGTSVEFDDGIEGRLFDNWQFIDFHSLTAAHPSFPDPAFALSALEEVPTQFKVASSLNLVGYSNPYMALPVKEATCLDPPIPDGLGGPSMTMSRMSMTATASSSSFFANTSGAGGSARFHATGTQGGGMFEDTMGGGGEGV